MLNRSCVGSDAWWDLILVWEAEENESSRWDEAKTFYSRCHRSGNQRGRQTKILGANHSRKMSTRTQVMVYLWSGRKGCELKLKMDEA